MIEKNFNHSSAMFHKWVSGIVRETTNLRKLVQKGMRFSWDEAVHGKEVNFIRGQTKNLLPLSPFDPKCHVFTDASLLGFGYCLLQHPQDGGWNIICCDSTGIKPNQCKWKP